MQADVFCRVIDNWGDIGVTWRLVRQLSTEKKWQIRLWLDDLPSLKRLEPTLDPDQDRQALAGVDVLRWPQNWRGVEPARVVIASFSCDLPKALIEQMARRQTRWLQLEYLSAERWVQDCHLRTSLRGDGLKPVFFFPGFETGTGGLLREANLLMRRDAWRADPAGQLAWLVRLGVSVAPQTRLGSVFAYPSAPLGQLIECLSTLERPTHLLVPDGVSFPRHLATKGGRVTWQTIPFLSQDDYDRLLWSMDFNLVRGEDSFVRAIWAGQPFIWQAYPQADGVHHDKVSAFLSLAGLPDPVNQLFHAWADGQAIDGLSALFAGATWRTWAKATDQLADRLANLPDLATEIDRWCRLPTEPQDTR